jgi:hypothetical protein
MRNEIDYKPFPNGYNSREEWEKTLVKLEKLFIKRVCHKRNRNLKGGE